MGLFGKKSKIEIVSTEGARVKVLGSDCDSCHKTYAAVSEAMQELGMKAEIEFITDLSQIVAYGVMTTPDLIVDDKVVFKGDLDQKKAIEILKKYL